MNARLLPILVCVAVAAGCNPGDARDIADDTGRLAKTGARAAGNAGLAAKVNTVLSLRKGVDMSGLHIEAEKGVVTVGGHVRNEEEKQRVLETVEGIRGVERVVDELRVES